MLARTYDVLWPGHPEHLSEVPMRLFPTAMNLTRLSAAGVVAYLLTLVATKGPLDLTGALTALLVVQASTYTTLKMGLVRVGAVLTGVAVALGLSMWSGLNWWSLGLAIFMSLALARILRLGDQALETPISAMLILGTSGHEIAAETRVITTFIGAGVGVVFAFLFPPVVPNRSAAYAVRRVAAYTAQALRLAGDSIARRPITRDEVTGWLHRAIGVNLQVSRAEVLVRKVGDARRYNPRTIGTADFEPLLRTGLTMLEHALMATRAVFLAIELEAPKSVHNDRAEPDGEVPPEGTRAGELRIAFSVLLAQVADAMDALGWLIQSQGQGAEEQAEKYQNAMDAVGECRAMLADLRLIDVSDDPSLWLFNPAILRPLDLLLDRIDPQTRTPFILEWEASQAGRRIASGQLLNRENLNALRKGQLSFQRRRVTPPQ